MTQSKVRARVAIGSSVVALGIGSAFAVASASASTPPPSEPKPTVDSAAEPGPAATSSVGGDRDGLVETIVSGGEVNGISLDRDCVAGIVAGIPDTDLPLVAADIEAATAVVTSLPDIELPELSMPEIEMPEITTPEIGSIPVELSALSIPDIEIPVITMPDVDAPPVPPAPLSPQTVALGRQLVSCVQGSADPALVDRVAAIVAEQDFAAGLDLDCVAGVLSMLPDHTLQLVIDHTAASAEGGTFPLSSIAVDEALGQLFNITICSTDGAAATATTVAG